MSMFHEYGTCMSDAGILKKCLATRFKQVEMHQMPQQLFDYNGKATHYTNAAGDKAEIIVRRKYVGDSANDIGFIRNAKTQNFDAIISEFDSHKHSAKWLENLSRDYLIAKSNKLMGEMEGELEDQQAMQDGSIRLRYSVAA